MHQYVVSLWQKMPLALVCTDRCVFAVHMLLRAVGFFFFYRFGNLSAKMFFYSFTVYILLFEAVDFMSSILWSFVS